MRNVDTFIEKIKTLRSYFRDELKWSQTKMKKQTNRNKYSTSKFRVENKVMLNAKYIKTMRSNNSLNHKNLDLYKITRAINNIVYELDLLEIMSNLFNVFHSWLLHLNDEKSFQNQMKKTSSRIEINEDIKWSIQKIIDSRINDRMNDSRTNIKECYNIASSSLKTISRNLIDKIESTQSMRSIS